MKKVHAVIIESTFFSLDKMAKNQFWFLPTKILSRFHFKNYEKIKNLKSKLLIIHSETDEIIPFSNGKKLYAAAKKPKNFLEISGSHNYGFTQSLDLYIRTIKNFL